MINTMGAILAPFFIKIHFQFKKSSKLIKLVHKKTHKKLARFIFLFNFNKKLLNVKFKRKEYVYFDVREQRVKLDRYSWVETIKWYMIKIFDF